MPSNHRRNAAARRLYDGPRRLAAAVLVKAVQDWLVWRSDRAARYRGMTRAERARARSKGVRRGPGEDWFRVAGGDNPAVWLGQESVFHRILDVDPGRLTAMLADPRAPERLRQAFGMPSNPKGNPRGGVA